MPDYQEREYVITYKYRFADGREVVYPLSFDTETSSLLNELRENLPEWTMLDVEQCANCTLKKKSHVVCPVAAHLAPIIRHFESLISYEPVHVYVITHERIITHYTTAQRALASIMELVMATCGCPVLELFRPMARFHLPVANDEETQYRALGMYMLSRLLRVRNGQKAFIESGGLLKIYADAQICYQALSARLTGFCDGDAVANAVIRLNSHAQSICFILDEYLDQAREVFDSYL